MPQTIRQTAGRRDALLMLAAVMPLAAMGCNGSGISDATIKSMTASINDCNGKRLANLYAMYQQASGSRPPNEKAFRSFIVGVNAAQLEAMGVSEGDLDAIFVSERDGRPFDIRYGASRGVTTMLRGHQAVVFESEGVNGRVNVYMTGPKVIEVDAAEVAAFKKGSRDEQGEETPLPPPGS